MTNIESYINSAILIVLISIRFGSLIMASPIFSGRAIPVHVKVILSLSIGFLLHSHVAMVSINIWSSTIEIMMAIVFEVIIGSFMGFTVHLLFLAVTLAFEIAGMQMGFAIARIFDPENNQQISVLSKFILIIAVFFFFSMNFHHYLMVSILYSYEKMPIGMFNFFDSPIIENLINFLSTSFEVAVRIATPIIITILAIQLVMGVISKTAPQMNMFFNIAFSINLSLGLIMVMTLLPRVRYFFESVGSNLTHHIFGLI